MLTYLDASAFVKLLVRETESEALARYLDEHPDLVSSAILRTEGFRAVRHLGAELVERARSNLARIRFVPVDDPLLDTAAVLDPAIMRTLDALHLASAVVLGEELETLVTYDQRMREGAELLGLPVAVPS